MVGGWPAVRGRSRAAFERRCITSNIVPSVRPMTGARTGSRVARSAPPGLGSSVEHAPICSLIAPCWTRASPLSVRHGLLPRAASAAGAGSAGRIRKWRRKPVQTIVNVNESACSSAAESRQALSLLSNEKSRSANRLRSRIRFAEAWETAGCFRTLRDPRVGRAGPVRHGQPQALRVAPVRCRDDPERTRRPNRRPSLHRPRRPGGVVPGWPSAGPGRPEGTCVVGWARGQIGRAGELAFTRKRGRGRGPSTTRHGIPGRIRHPKTGSLS